MGRHSQRNTKLELASHHGAKNPEIRMNEYLFKAGKKAIA